MANYAQTKDGLWVPDVKSDRSAGAAVRGMTSTYTAESRYKTFSQYLKAVRVPWVYPCVRLIAYNFANCDWSLMEGENRPVEDDSDPFLVLMERPNEMQSGFHFKMLYQFYMQLVGEAFITLEERDGFGRPRELYLPNPANMRVVPDRQGDVKAYLYDAGGGVMIPYDPDEVIHIKMPNPLNPYRGMGPVEASAVILDIVDAMSYHELSYYKSGGRITGVLETEVEVTDEDFEKIKREWRAFSADTQQRLKTAILQNGLKYTPIAEGMKAVNMVEVNKDKRDQILAVWGVPKTKLGILEDAQYKEEDANKTFWNETMDPPMTQWEMDIQPLIDLFDDGRFWEFARKNFEADTDKFTNSKAMQTTYSFTVDEIRKYNGLDPLPNGQGDVIFVPNTMVPIHMSDLGEMADQTLIDATAPPEPPPAPGGGGPTGPATVPDGQGPGQAKPKASGSPTTGLGAPHTPQKGTPAPMADTVQKMLASGDDFERAWAERILADQEKAAAASRGRRARAGRRMRAQSSYERLQLPQGKAVARVASTSRQPASVAFMRQATDQFINRARESATPEIRRHFRAQQRRVSRALADVLKGLGKDSTKQEVESRLRPLIVDNSRIGDALGGLHASAVAAGFHAGQRVLPPRNANILAARAVRKSADAEGKAVPAYIPPDSPDWRTFVEDWRATDPELAGTFDRYQTLAARIDETTLASLADQVYTGLQRGYSALQIAQGVPDESFGGISGVWEDATDWRSEMIARSEAREAFVGGALRTYAMAEVEALEAVDGVQFDEGCRDRNGEIYKMDPATGQPVGGDVGEHPNGGLTFVPASVDPRDVDFS